MFGRFHGSDPVKGGTYLCLNTGEFLNVPDEGGRLPGEANLLYAATPPLLALFVGPIVGMLFVIFLPLAVPLFVAWLIAGKIRAGVPALASQVASAVGRQPVYAAGRAEGGLSTNGHRRPAARRDSEEMVAKNDEDR